MQVVGHDCPPFRELTESEDAAAVRRINEARADVVWVGLGAPKQEKWMAVHAGRIHAAAMIGVGAAFDFHTGNVKWAAGVDAQVRAGMGVSADARAEEDVEEESG